MIEYLRVEITPTNFSDTNLRELKIRIRDSRVGDCGSTQICKPDELISFFDQIWDCAGKKLLHYLKESMNKTLPTAPLQAPESPVEA